MASGRIKRKRKGQSLSDSKDRLKGRPQRRGVCVRVFRTSPKKPNSANRAVVQLRRSGSKELVVASVPGEGHNIAEHARVLVKGGRRKDLPGVRHQVIRGALDCLGVPKRRTSRSKYGRPKDREG